MSTQTNPPPPRPGGGEDDSLASDARAKAQEVTGQAQQMAQGAAGQAQDKLRDQLDQRSSQVAEQINEQASDLRSVAESLREQSKHGPAKAADRLAGYAEKVGGYLRDKDSDGLLSDAEDFGRRQPAVVAGGGLLLGFLASRFLKASSSRRYSSQRAGELPAPRSPRPAVPPRPAPDRVRTASTPPVPEAGPLAPGSVAPARPRA
jgi:uncharacterized membrane-anchored protein YhcB (DUF1043 family)